MLKKSHSKVKQLNHNAIKMQKYLQANQTNIKREEAQLIFKLRCKVTEVKVNLKSKTYYSMWKTESNQKNRRNQLW